VETSDILYFILICRQYLFMGMFYTVSSLPLERLGLVVHGLPHASKSS
jgi:1,4-dihydroxy-2-naphthoate octaprenyltransferase